MSKNNIMKKSAPLDEILKRDKQIMRLAEKGCNVKEIMEYMDVGLAMVRDCFRRNKEEVAYMRSRQTEERRTTIEGLKEQVREMKRKHMKIPDIAKKVGRSVNWVSPISVDGEEYSCGAKVDREFKNLSEEEREKITEKYYHASKRIPYEEKRRLIRTTRIRRDANVPWKYIETELDKSRAYLFQIVREDDRRIKAEITYKKLSAATGIGHKVRWSPEKKEEARQCRAKERAEDWEGQKSKKHMKKIEEPKEEEVPQKKVIIYTRVSTEEQTHGESMGIQEQSAKAYAKAKEWIVEAVFSDPGKTATKITTRPGIQATLKRISEGDIDVFLVWKVDRAFRNLREAMDTIYGKLKVYGCDFAAVMESFDTSTPAGEAMLGILLVFAQLESKTIGLRVSQTRQAQKKRGAWLGTCVEGYKRMEGKLERVEPEHEKLKEMFRMWKRGESAHQIHLRTNMVTTAINRKCRRFRNYREYCSYYEQWAESCSRPVNEGIP